MRRLAPLLLALAACSAPAAPLPPAPAPSPAPDGRAVLDDAFAALGPGGRGLAAAREAARRAIPLLDDGKPETLWRRGRAHELCGDAARAEADFTAAIEFAPARFARARLRFGRWWDAVLDVGGGRPRGEPWDRLKADALVDLEAARADNELACDAMTRCLDEKPADAAELLERAPSDADLSKLKGDAHYFASGVDIYRRRGAEGNDAFAKAVAAYDAAVAARPAFPEALAMRGYVRSQLGYPREAAADFEAALAIDPKHPRTLVLFAGLLAADKGTAERALGLYAAALEAKPDSYYARANRAVLLAGLGRTDEALRDLEEALRLRPAVAFAWQLKGAALGRLRQWEEADVALTKALDLDPTFPTVWYNRGAIRAGAGHTTEAVADFREALRRGHPYPDRIREILRKLGEDE